MELHELKAKMTDICEVKENLISMVKNQVFTNAHCVNTKELGEVVDMIKDLAETEKVSYEALYYESVIEAMHGIDDERYGYNPAVHQMPYIHDYIKNPTQFEHDMHENRGKTSYDHYKLAKRYYTESHSDKDKKEMDMHADAHVNEVMTSIRDIWSSADPEMRKRMKNSLSGLLGEMTV